MSDILTPYLDAFQTFEAGLNGQASSPVHKLRRDAIARFEEIGFPTSRDEAWKTVNLSPVTAAYVRAGRGDATVSDEAIAAVDLDVGGWTIVFVDGFFDEAHSDIDGLPDGLTISPISRQLGSGVDAFRDHLSKIAGFEEHAFTALNTAFLTDGAFVHATPGTVVEKPIHVVYLSTVSEKPTVSYARSLFVVEKASQVTIVETFAGAAEGDYMTNHVAEIAVGDDAHLDHYKIGLESRDAKHVSNQESRQGKSSTLRSHSISIGGGFVRNDISSALDGENCESRINGLYVLNGSQHCDHYTLLDHRKPNCPSHELYKGILDDEARAIFRGKIHVHQVAQKTDAYQQNANVLLSEDARVNTKPQLEIYADDVKCSHGATIGQLDEDALFYLESRGIPEKTAHRMLIEAFANDILSRVRIEGLREALKTRVLDKITDKETT